MKNKSYFLALLGLISLSFILLPEGTPKTKKTSSIVQSAGIYTIECKGKTYKATVVEGNVIMPPKKKNIYFLMSTEIRTGGKIVRLDIHFRNQDDFTAGKTYTLGKIEGDDEHPRTMLYSESVPSGSEGDEEVQIAASSETGTFTLTAMKVSGQQVTVSGKFEFKGKNDINEESITVKGTFANTQLRYISSEMYRP
ncbi:hypothetical protein GGR22_003056 [Flavobacterium gossypii]|uniref:YceI family protein n=1 Tax=Flavobacterium gossypii TaxID=1646119 RepID=A0ABR6DTV0_9FLAO|nr:hypothetical protein [Flavobacterium gossypii]MBA9074879.1 hypothetical protein [Flavobacterium gossypii]